jgi:tol-pal system protein YbgF
MPRPCFFLSCCAIFLLASACTVGRPPTEAHRTDLEYRLAAVEERLSELSRQVAKLQPRLDHQGQSVPEGDPTPAAAGPRGRPADVRPAGPATAENPPQPAAATRPPGPPRADPAGKATEGAQASPEALYRQALIAYQEGKFRRASALFEAYYAQYPRHPLADNALYWTGECHYARKRYLKAIDTFKSVLKDYPDGGKVPDALLKTGYSYLALGDKTTGRRYLQEVIRQYPFSSAGAKAEERLKVIR